MTSKPIVSAVLAALLVFGLAANETQAGNDVATGILIGAGVVAFAAAASAANAHRGRPHYAYDHGIGARDNALATCLHRADRYLARRHRGKGIELRRVKYIRPWGPDGFRVSLKLYSYGPWGREKSKAKCWVRHDRVSKMQFKF